MKAKRILSIITAVSAAFTTGFTVPVSSDNIFVTQAAQTMWGDANESGGINVADAVAVLQYIANRTKYPLSAKGMINADIIDPGKGITGTDALAIQMIDAQLLTIDELPMSVDDLANHLHKQNPRPEITTTAPSETQTTTQAATGKSTTPATTKPKAPTTTQAATEKSTTPATTKPKALTTTQAATGKATTPATTKPKTPTTTQAATGKSTTPATTKPKAPTTTQAATGKATTLATTKPKTPATTQAATGKSTTPATTKPKTPTTTQVSVQTTTIPGPVYDLSDPLVVTDPATKKLTIYGDLDGNAKLDGKDLELLNDIADNNKTYDSKADLDGDKDVDSDDIQLLQDFILGNSHCFPVYSQFDSDEDGINDYAEIEFFHTDNRKSDTDDDGLTDYEEVLYANTDPKVYDSVKKGVSDADADKDGDGLSNIKELSLNTNPCIADTDNDGLSDGYEVNKTKSDPLNIDTDGDDITDFEEVELGIDPLNTVTDGTPDKERIFTQIIPADDPIFAGINTEDNAYNLSVEIEAAGYAKNLLEVRESVYSYALKDSSAIGIAPEFIYYDDFEVKSITLNFEIKEPFRDNVSHYFDNVDGDYYDYEYEIDPELDGIKRLNVFKYFNEISLSMPIFTEYDLENNTVKVTVDTFEKDEEGYSYGIGSYALVDLEVWSQMMNAVDEADSDVVTDDQGFMRATSSTKINAGGRSIKKTLTQISDSVRNLITRNYQASSSKSSNAISDCLSLLSLFGHSYAYYESPGISWSAAASACRAKGGHLITVTSPFEFSFLNGSLSSGKSGLYWVGATGGPGSWSWCTNESISYARTITAYGYTMDTCGTYFSGLGNCLAYAPRLSYSTTNFPTPSSIKGYICEWEPGAVINDSDAGIVSFRLGGGSIGTLRGPLSPTSGIDSDGDGVPDWDEVNHDAIKKLGGKSGDSNVPWSNALDFTRRTGTNSNQNSSWTDKIKNLINRTVNVTPTNTNPQDVDSDGDGIPDSRDAMPNAPYDSTFELTSSYEKISSNDYIDDLDDYADSIYDTASLSEWAGATFNFSGFRAWLNSVGGPLAGFNHASDFMDHFLDNNGKDYKYDADEVVDYTNSGNNWYLKHMNTVRDLCESTVVDELKFKTVSSASLTATEFSTYGVSSETNQNLAKDWWFSIGNAMAAVSLDCSKSGSTYTAKIRYYVLDYYDWQEGSEARGGLVNDGEMFMLHKAGKAREYRSIGLYETTMTWTDGYRYVVNSEGVEEQSRSRSVNRSRGRRTR